MLRPDHLFLHDLTNAHHQDLSRNVEELQHGPERRSSEQLQTSSTCLGGLQVENMPAAQICAMLKTDAERGLTEEMARARLAKDGPNQLQQQPRFCTSNFELQRKLLERLERSKRESSDCASRKPLNPEAYVLKAGD
ncbi:hypothetical protein AK812_SmicGene8843 [Symbiodinium microadriaticum]|uniref:Cation-transporting P-type ATPase N-terminal domain-containing protein n=1 Tax=Symbiodinium microadriaticum TaxID=2951 RepID=A0A1Q9EJZ3_SYMMI|nr:hypothetical protein AK812_SmicGene8843 [Symbiodinium microadriaticum]